jgi:DNA helicase HerA-like ATPase
MKELAFLFAPQSKKTISAAIEEFLVSKDSHVLRISLEGIPFGVNAREILANAIGRSLLQKARAGSFRGLPVIVMLDEAHQFLNKRIGDETLQVHLDAFSLIAKEGRKYGLSAVIATQRPRDIPDDVLSQMGTMIVHRLVSHFDRETVERASGELDKSAAAFLPVLGQGEALIIGVDFPIPLAVRVIPPKAPPQSKGPDYQNSWCSP